MMTTQVSQTLLLRVQFQEIPEGLNFKLQPQGPDWMRGPYGIYTAQGYLAQFPDDDDLVMVEITRQHIREAMQWISECVWGDLAPEDVPGLLDQEVLQGIQRHYEGGLLEFLKNCSTHWDAIAGGNFYV